MDALLFLVIFMIAIYICWNCEINQSSLLLVILLGVAIIVLANPGTEQFLDNLTIADLNTAGFKRPSLMNLTPKIGVSPEMSWIFATKNDM